MKGRNPRRVPIPAVLRDHLVEHRMRSAGEGLVFGVSPVSPFRTKEIAALADKAWKRANLARITLHECRHTFASLMIAAGVNAKALSTYMGHANISITLDRYDHLMPGNEHAPLCGCARRSRIRGLAGDSGIESAFPGKREPRAAYPAGETPKLGKGSAVRPALVGRSLL